MPVAAMPGAASGSTTCTMALVLLQPSTCAASSSSTGISLKNPITIHTTKGRAKVV